MKIVVSDPSAISNLISIRRIELFKLVFGTVYIPPRVASELSVAHDQLPPFIKTHTIDTPSHVVGSEQLDPGELEAIELALEINADTLIIDDKAGRITATDAGIQCIGILGVLVVAKALGHLEAVAPVLAELEANRFFFSEAVKREVLHLVDEKEVSK